MGKSSTKAFLIVVAVVVIVVLAWGFKAGWGKSSSTTTSDETAGLNQTPTETTKVKIENFTYNPKMISVGKGKTVIWTNNDAMTHTITADDGKFDSGQLLPGKTFKFTFSETGTFSYHCSNHQAMVGTVTVK